MLHACFSLTRLFCWNVPSFYSFLPSSPPPPPLQQQICYDGCWTLESSAVPLRHRAFSAPSPLPPPAAPAAAARGMTPRIPWPQIPIDKPFSPLIKSFLFYYYCQAFPSFSHTCRNSPFIMVLFHILFSANLDNVEEVIPSPSMVSDYIGFAYEG